MGDSFRPEFKGRSNAPAFYKGGKSVRQRSNSNTNAVGPLDTSVVIFGLVTFAVGTILFFRSREPVTHTGPALTVIPSAEADLSTIENDIRAVEALNVHFSNLLNPPPAVSGNA
jgi:hypothetical protein